MEGKRQHIIAFYIGLSLMAFGFASDRFLIIRPNRIESGTGMDMIAALKSTNGLWAALFLFFVLLLIYCIARHSRCPGRLVVVLGALMLAMLGFTAVAAGSVLSVMEGPARASLGSGFWLMFTGIVLMIQGAARMLKNHGVLMSLVIFTVLSAFVWLMYMAGWLESISIAREIANKSDQFSREIIRHLHLSVASAVTGLVISLFFSYWAYRRPGLKKVVTTIANGAQVIPTLSLLGMIMIPLAALAVRYPMLKAMGISGIGFFPAFIALTLYTLLPITASTMAGFNTIDDNIILSAKAMGMNKSQMLARIELPLAMPAILSGFKTALVQTVGNCILAGMVAGGGLGSILFLGLAQSAPDLVVAASLMVVFLALFLNMLLSALELMLRKRYGGVVIDD